MAGDYNRRRTLRLISMHSLGVTMIGVGRNSKPRSRDSNRTIGNHPPDPPKGLPSVQIIFPASCMSCKAHGMARRLRGAQKGILRVGVEPTACEMGIARVQNPSKRNTK